MYYSIKKELVREPQRFPTPNFFDPRFALPNERLRPLPISITCSSAVAATSPRCTATTAGFSFSAAKCVDEFLNVSGWKQEQHQSRPRRRERGRHFHARLPAQVGEEKERSDSQQQHVSGEQDVDQRQRPLSLTRVWLIGKWVWSLLGVASLINWVAFPAHQVRPWRYGRGCTPRGRKIQARPEKPTNYGLFWVFIINAALCCWLCL